MRVVILGGYGLIGREIMHVLAAAGFDVVGLGRDKKLGERLFPRARWIGADLSQLTTAENWAPHVQGVDAIVNAAGALQDGPRDRLAAVHDVAIRACVAAAEAARVAKWVQISAPGAREDASTEFLCSKARGDAAVRASALEWVIFKPGLVISANAYGGTALLRMLAGFPLVQPLVLAEAKMQTVSADDVARAVADALQGRVSMRTDFDLVEDQPHSLAEIVAAFRAWLGFREPVATLRLPRAVGAAAGRLADVAGLLGWRSSLRTTSLRVLSEDVIGNPAEWSAASGYSMKPLRETLAALPPASAQDRVFARAQLVLPLAIVTLAVFWLVSGLVGLARLDASAAHLFDTAGEDAAKLMVVGGSLIDIAIGAGFICRSTTRLAALASIAVSAFYLAAGTFVAPELWFDPLGVMVKVLPAMMLSLAVALLVVER